MLACLIDDASASWTELTIGYSDRRSSGVELDDMGSFWTAIKAFFKHDPRGWKVDEDVYVQRNGRDEYFVSLGQKRIRLVAEMGTRPDRSIYRSDVKLADGGTLSEEDLDLAIAVLTKYFDRQNTTWEIR